MPSAFCPHPFFLKKNHGSSVTFDDFPSTATPFSANFFDNPLIFPPAPFIRLGKKTRLMEIRSQRRHNNPNRDEEEE